MTKVNITIKDRSLEEKFLGGGYVFRISAVTPGQEPRVEKDHGMVNTREEFEHKLNSHYYISLLYISRLTYKLAYLYDCLDREPGVPRKETFIFYLRELHKHEWKEWFVVNSSNTTFEL